MMETGYPMGVHRNENEIKADPLFGRPLSLDSAKWIRTGSGKIDAKKRVSNGTGRLTC